MTSSAAPAHVLLVHLRGWFAGQCGLDLDRPRRRFGLAGQHPGGLTGRADRHVLVGFWQFDVHAEDRGGQRAHGRELGSAADQQDALDVHAQTLDQFKAVALRAQQTLHERAGDVLSPGVRQRHAVQRRRGVRTVRRTLAVEVRHQRDASGTRFRGRGQFGQFVVAHAECGASGIGDARTVDRAGQRQPMSGAVGESGHRSGHVVGGHGGDGRGHARGAQRDAYVAHTHAQAQRRHGVVAAAGADRQRGHVVEPAGLFRGLLERLPLGIGVHAGAVGVLGLPETDHLAGLGVGDAHLGRLGGRVHAGHQNSAHCASLQHAAKNVGLMAFVRIRLPLYANSLTNELYWCVYHFHNVVGGTPEAMKHQNT